MPPAGGQQHRATVLARLLHHLGHARVARQLYAHHGHDAVGGQQAAVAFLDGCALTLPCHAPGEAPVGLMLAGCGGQDDRVLAAGAAVERVLGDAHR